MNRQKAMKRNQYTPNETIIKGNMAEIILYNKKHQEVARVIIDAGDVPKVEKHKWCLNKGYASTLINKKTVRMSNFIMDFKPNPQKLIDHRDRNTLNNRKFNLRECSFAENHRNSGTPINNTSGFKGVSRSGEKWRSYISVNNKSIHIGCFENIIKAAKAYNEAAIKHHGEFACLNSF